MKLWRKALACLAAVATLASVSVLASAEQSTDEVPQGEQGASQESAMSPAPAGFVKDGSVKDDSSKEGSANTVGADSKGSKIGQAASGSSKSSTSKDQDAASSAAKDSAPLAKKDSLPNPGASDSKQQPKVSAQNDSPCVQMSANAAYAPTTSPTAIWDATPDPDGGCTIRVHGGYATLSFLPWNQVSEWTPQWDKLVTNVIFDNVTIYNPANYYSYDKHDASSLVSRLPNLKSVDVSGLKFMDDANDVALEKMFSNDPKLERIKGLSHLDVSHVMNMAQMFADDPLLTELDLSSWQTDNVYNVSEMFSGDTSLKKVNLSGWKTANMGRDYTDPSDINRVDQITGSLAGMFSDDTSLTSVDLTGWQVGGVKDFSDMFSNCSSLTEIKGIDSSQWTTLPAHRQPLEGDGMVMSDMFKGASSLKSLDLHNWNMHEVCDVSGMFSNAASLQTVDASSWDVSEVRDFSGMFDGASSLTKIKGIETWQIEGWPLHEDRTMADMFRGAKSLKRMDLSNWDTFEITDMSGMFADNTALTNAELPRLNVSNVRNLSGIFEGDTALENVNLTGWNVAKVTDLSNLFANETSLKTVNLSGWNTTNVTNMSGMFMGDTKLEKVIGLKDLDTSNVTDMSGMFATVNQIKKLPEPPAEAVIGPQDEKPSINFDDIKGWNVGKVQKFDQMFMGRDDLGRLDLSQWKPGEQVSADPSQTVSVRAMFAGDSALTKVGGVSSWKTDKVSDMSYMFYQCKSLDKLGDLSNWKTDNVTNMEGMFRYDTALKDVSGMGSWNTGNVKSMAGMFQRNRKRNDLGDVSGWNTSNVEQMWDMFGGDSNLKRIDVSQWNTSNVKSMTYMFQGTALKSLDLSNWNTTKVQDVPAQNITKCSQNEAKTTDGTCKILPENLQEITVGDATKLRAESFSEDPMDADGYTGSWVSDDNSWASNADNANQDLANHLATGGVGPQDESETPHKHTYRWQESVSITFDANLPKGANYQGGLPDDITAVGARASDLQQRIPAAQPKAEGYTFAGWNTTFDGGADGTAQPGKAYKAGDTLTLSRGKNVTLYAQWKAVTVPPSQAASMKPHYVVHYDANAPEGVEATGETQDDAFDVVIAEHGNRLYQPRALAENGFKVEGYQFVGWSRTGTDDKDTKIYRPGTELNVGPGTTTLYAHWQKGDSSANRDGSGPSASGEDAETVIVTIPNPTGQGVQLQTPAPVLTLPSRTAGAAGVGRTAGAAGVGRTAGAAGVGRTAGAAGVGQTAPRDGSVAPAPIVPKNNGPKCLPRPVSYEGSAQGAAWFASSNSAALPYCDSEDATSAAPSVKATRVGRVQAMLWIVIAAAVLALCAIVVRQRFASLGVVVQSQHRDGNRDE